MSSSLLNTMLLNFITKPNMTYVHAHFVRTVTKHVVHNFYCLINNSVSGKNNFYLSSLNRGKSLFIRLFSRTTEE